MTNPQTTKTELNCNTPPTVETVIAWLQQFPSAWTVTPYEGEGGNWILVGLGDADDDD